MSADLAFFLPPLTAGSGGHRTVLRYAAGMAERGYEVVCVVEASQGDVRAEATRLWPTDGVRFEVGFDRSVDAAVAYATAWHTARTVAAAEGPTHRAYLVQDLERWFHPVGQHWVDAEVSLDLGLTPVALGRWLATQLTRETGQAAHVIDFGVDLATYHPGGAPPPGPPRIAFLVQPDKPRRLSEVVLGAARALADLRPDASLLVYGSHSAPPPGPWTWLGNLDEPALAELYRECAVGVCVSLTNPSRIPFEMLACGLPVVDVFRETTLLDLPSPGVTLAVPSAASLAGSVARLLGDPRRRQAAAAAGIAFARGRPDRVELDGFQTAHDAIVAGAAPRSLDSERIEPSEPVCAAADRDWGPRYVTRHRTRAGK